MAVRNLEAIQRQGTMIANQVANAKKMTENHFWERINIIRQSRADAIDAVDTIEALFKNGLRNKYDEWQKQQNVRYSPQFKEFTCDGIWDETKVCYRPYEDDVKFGWSAHGMCESYSINNNTTSMDYFIHQRLSNKDYDKKLSRLVTNLQPFLDVFFKWVETI